MIALAIAKKNFIEFFRNIKSNLIVIILPVLFFVIFGFIFNRSNDGIIFPIAVVNETKMQPQNQAIIKAISEIKQSDNTALFTISKFDHKQKAMDSVSGNANVLVITEKSPSGITMAGDMRNVYFSSASSVIAEVANKVYGIDSSLVEKSNINISLDKNFTAFDLLVPGLIVYGLLIMIPHNTGQFTQLVSDKKIFRLFLSHATGKDIILGYLLSQTAIVLFQTVLLFFVAQMFGFKTSANVFELLVVAVPTNLFIVGISLLIGGLVKNSGDATNMGTIVSVVLGFLSGSFIVGIENIMRMGEFMGHQLSFNQIFPSTFAVQAWTQMMLYGKHIPDVGFELAGLTIISILILIVGVWIYNKKQLVRID